MKKLIIAAACVVALASCSNDNKSTTNTTAPAVTATPNAAPATTPAAPAGNVQTVSTDGNGQIQLAPQAGQTNTPSPDAGVAPKSGTINPPHGQPGHSCAVQVGQPIP